MMRITQGQGAVIGEADRCKKITYTILCIFAAAFLTLAACPKEILAYTPVVHLSVLYSDDIIPQTGDTFTITYKVDGSDTTSEMKFDASFLAGKTGKIDMDIAMYDIVSIEYTGYNKDIEKQGYAILGSFEVTADEADYPELMIGVGREAGEKLESVYSDVLIRANGQFYRSFSEITEDDDDIGTATTASTSDWTFRERPESYSGADSTAYSSSDFSDDEEWADASENEDDGDIETQESENPISKILPMLVILAAAAGTYVFIRVRKRNEDDDEEGF